MVEALGIWPSDFALGMSDCQSFGSFLSSCFSFFSETFPPPRIAYNAVMAAGEDSTFHWNVVVSLFNDFGSRALIADSATYNMLSSSCGDLALKKPT